MKEQTLISRHTTLSAHLVAFCRYLREQGFTIGPSEEANVLEAISLLHAFTDPNRFYLCLRTVLTKSFRQQQAFDQHFDTYWNEMAKAVDSKIKEGKESKKKKSGQQAKKQKAPSTQELKNWLYGKKTKDEMTLAAYSPGKDGGGTDLSGFSETGLQELIKIIHLLARSLANRKSRRFQKSKRPGHFDLRKTLRSNLRRGGEIMHLNFKKTQQQKLELVLLCDVSKSMDLYSRFLVQFLYAFQNNYRQIETFVFSTSLHRITPTLQQSTFDDILDQLSTTVPDWSGGTRIGASFHNFLENYGSKYLNHRSIVLIMSDGWDTGDIDLLESSMRKIYRKSGRVIWLNPLAGRPGYETNVKGMQTALPFIDVFAPAHNVESLKQVVKKLKGRQKTRKWF